MNKTFPEALDDLRVALLDFWFALFDGLGIIAFTKRLGMTERQWVTEARERRQP